MVTNYPQQLTAAADVTGKATHGSGSDVPHGQPARSGRLRTSRPRCGAAFRGQPRHDAVHVVRSRHARVGSHRAAVRACATKATPGATRSSRGWCCARALSLNCAAESAWRPQHHSSTSAAERVAARHDVARRDVLLAAVKPRSARTEQDRRDASRAKDGRVGPETHPDSCAPWPLPSAVDRVDEQARQRVVRLRARMAAARTSASRAPRTPDPRCASASRIAVTSSSAARHRSLRPPFVAPSAAGSDPDTSSTRGHRCMIDACSEPAPEHRVRRTRLAVADRAPRAAAARAPSA